MKIAVVTGANRGLGLGTAEALAKQNYLVFMLGRDAKKLDQAAAPLVAQGLPVRPFPFDVTNETDIARLASVLTEEFGHLDALVNNAGVFLESNGDFNAAAASVFKAPLDVIVKTFETNTLAPLRIIQVLAPLLRAADEGRVVNVSSGMGALTDMSGAWPGYRISKTALNAVTRMFATEFSSTRVKVNSVCPGWVRTDMGGKNANRSIQEGVSGIVWAATLPKNGPTGGFFREGKPIDW